MVWPKIGSMVLGTYFTVFPAMSGELIQDQGSSSAASLILREAGDHRLILLGELHGTRQVPRLVGRLVSDYSRQGPVMLGVEMESSEAEGLRRYLASDGGTEAQAALLASPFWKVDGTQHDGRRNYEALGLIEQVRRLRTQGRDVSILPYDELGTAGVASSQARDEVMARRLRNAMESFPRGRLIVLSGNVHAMRERPKDAPSEMQTPMGAYLSDLHPYAINITANGGEFWACMKTCGPVAVQQLRRRSGRVTDGPYDLQVVLPRFSIAHLVSVKPAL